MLFRTGRPGFANRRAKMQVWQCESEWGWGIYVFSPCRRRAPHYLWFWTCHGQTRCKYRRITCIDIFAQVCTESGASWCLHKVCTGTPAAQDLHTVSFPKLPTKTHIMLANIEYSCYSLGNENTKWGNHGKRWEHPVNRFKSCRGHHFDNSIDIKEIMIFLNRKNFWHNSFA